jgi:hypothetical protein
MNLVMGDGRSEGSGEMIWAILDSEEVLKGRVSVGVVGFYCCRVRCRCLGMDGWSAQS